VDWRFSRAASNIKTLSEGLAPTVPARRVANRIAEAVEGLAQRNTGRPGRVRDTFEKSIVGLPYIVAFAVEVHDGVERIVVLRVIHTARHWPPGQWPKP